jgi:hypothetical protein
MARRNVKIIKMQDGIQYNCTLMAYSCMNNLNLNIDNSNPQVLWNSQSFPSGVTEGSYKDAFATYTDSTFTKYTRNGLLRFFCDNNDPSGDAGIDVLVSEFDVSQKVCTIMTYDCQLDLRPNAYLSLVVDDDQQLGWIISHSIIRVSSSGSTVNYYSAAYGGTSLFYNKIIANEHIPNPQAIITWSYLSGNDTWTYRVRPEYDEYELSNIIKNNGNSNIRAEYSNKPTIYNSALFMYEEDATNTIYLTFMSEEPVKLYLEYVINDNTEWTEVKTMLFKTAKTNSYAYDSLTVNGTYNKLTYMTVLANYIPDNVEFTYSYLPIYRTLDELNDYYTYITNITLDWHSVASITGKGNTVNLPVLLETDGSPQVEKDTSVFNNLPLDSCNVKRLANLAMIGE